MIVVFTYSVQDGLSWPLSLAQLSSLQHSIPCSFYFILVVQNLLPNNFLFDDVIVLLISFYLLQQFTHGNRNIHLMIITSFLFTQRLGRAIKIRTLSVCTGIQGLELMKDDIPPPSPTQSQNVICHRPPIKKYITIKLSQFSIESIFKIHLEQRSLLLGMRSVLTVS